MTIPIFKKFLKRYDLRYITLKEKNLQKVYSYLVNPGGSKITSDKGFVRTENGQMGGSHWIGFFIKT